MSYAPIVMFVYNRADHFEKTVSALSKCPEARQSDLFIFSDGPKNEQAEAMVREVRCFARKLQGRDLFKSITITESKANKGLAASVIDGITKVFETNEKMISIEDDCVASPYLLKYLNSCIDFFENNKRIGCVAGFSPIIEFPADYAKDVFTAYRSCSCTWATWKDRWQNVDWELEDISELYKDKDIINRLNANGNERLIRLYRQANGGKDSWSIKFGYHLIKNNMLTVYPRYSYITNIGGDNSGVHSQYDDAENLIMDLSKAIPDPKIENVEIDDRIQKEMKKFYSDGLISDLKRAIASKAIIMKEKHKRT